MKKERDQGRECANGNLKVKESRTGQERGRASEELFVKK